MKRAPQVGESPCRTPGCSDDLVQPEDRDHREEQQDHRAEQPADGARPKPLHGEQADQDRERQRYHEVREARADDAQTTDCGRDRDRRRDHPVAEEQPGAEDPERTTSTAMWGRRRRCTSAVNAMMPPSPRLWARMMKPAYLIDTSTISVQKISDAIPYTPARSGVGRVAVGGEDELLGVQRAGADVAEHDPERAQREHEPAAWAIASSRIVVGGLQRGRRSALLRPRLGLDRPVAELVRGLVEAPFRP